MFGEQRSSFYGRLIPVIRRAPPPNRKYDQSQSMITTTRLRKPIRKKMCAAPHSSQAAPAPDRRQIAEVTISER